MTISDTPFDAEKLKDMLTARLAWKAYHEFKKRTGETLKIDDLVDAFECCVDIIAGGDDGEELPPIVPEEAFRCHFKVEEETDGVSTPRKPEADSPRRVR